MRNPIDGLPHATVKLRLVGYWKAQLDDELPFPQELERENDPNVRERVATYLDAGPHRIGYRGYSFCRYGCSNKNGSSELTDGRWTWPQGLSHYVRAHAIALPPELVADACADERRALFGAADAKVEAEVDCRTGSSGHARFGSLALSGCSSKLG